MPVITDPAEVDKDLAPATLSAITHGKNPIIELISRGLGELPSAALWRKLVAVDLSFYKSPLFEEVREEARAQGMAQGMAESRAKDILRLLDRRGIDVTDTDRERIRGCDDLDVLGRWFDRAITATSAEAIFTEGDV
ncbi:hypothetical protein AB0N07_08345 [Streptomyces sp. NPDC051172]|uniref:hypothetical protein n=1 Tax=Streptomyces sp. NPDC051172 TaxID=3155796 RepID=UPI0034225C43